MQFLMVARSAASAGSATAALAREHRPLQHALHETVAVKAL
jgi:hypothetical protein